VEDDHVVAKSRDEAPEANLRIDVQVHRDEVRAFRLDPLNPPALLDAFEPTHAIVPTSPSLFDE
jgi:hypothetical protein